MDCGENGSPGVRGRDCHIVYACAKKKIPNKMFMVRPDSRQRSSPGGLSQVFPSQSNCVCDLIKYGRYSVHLIQHGCFLLIHAVLFFLLCSVRLSGYMGRGLHNGRNGPPQNPFPGKGLYPCDGSSSAVHFGRHPARVLLHLRIVSDGAGSLPTD